MSDRHLRARGAAAGAAALLVLATAGCGGGGDERQGTTSATVADTVPATTQAATGQGGASSATDKLLITESIDAVFASGDPSKACEQYVTEAYVTRTFGDADGCRAAQVPGAAANSVKVERIDVNGERATADALPQGGPSGGQTVHVSLVYESGAWKVDSAKSDVPVGP